MWMSLDDTMHNHGWTALDILDVMGYSGSHFTCLTSEKQGIQRSHDDYTLILQVVNAQCAFKQ